MTTLYSWICGDRVAASEEKTSSFFDPSTGESIGELAHLSPLALVQNLQKIYQGQKSWARKKREDKAAVFDEVAARLTERQEELAQREATNQGLPLKHTRIQVIEPAIELFKRQALALRENSRMNQTGPDYRSHLQSPLGVVAAISGPIHPVYSVAKILTAALSFGNAVIIKPSSKTPYALDLFGEILAESSLPGEVWSFAFGSGQEIGEFLIGHPAISAVDFQGRLSTGQQVRSLASQNIKRCRLELGGKNSAIALKDASPEVHAPLLAQGCLSNQCQMPTNISRIWVPEKKREDWLEALQQAFQSNVMGSATDDTTTFGPLITKTQVESFHQQVDKISSSRRGLVHEIPLKSSSQPISEGNFVLPTIIEELNFCEPIHQDELLAPLILFNTYKTTAEAIKWANTTYYGRAAYLLTDPETSQQPQRREKLGELAAQLDVGQVFVNRWDWHLNDEGRSIKMSGEGEIYGLKWRDFYAKSNLLLS